MPLVCILFFYGRMHLFYEYTNEECECISFKVNVSNADYIDSFSLYI